MGSSYIQPNLHEVVNRWKKGVDKFFKDLDSQIKDLKEEYPTLPHTVDKYSKDLKKKYLKILEKEVDNLVSHPDYSAGAVKFNPKTNKPFVGKHGELRFYSAKERNVDSKMHGKHRESIIGERDRFLKSLFAGNENMLYLLETLIKADDLSEERRIRAHKNSFGKYTTGVITGDTPILSEDEEKDEEEDNKKSLRLYVSV